MNVIASSGEHMDMTFDLHWYLPLTHIKLAYHRSRAPAPRHLYMNPVYCEATRLLRVVLFHKRLTGLQKMSIPFPLVFWMELRNFFGPGYPIVGEIIGYYALFPDLR